MSCYNFMNSGSIYHTGSLQPRITIKVSDERGNATKNPKNVPYNPLERGE